MEEGCEAFGALGRNSYTAPFPRLIGAALAALLVAAERRTTQTTSGRRHNLMEAAHSRQPRPPVHCIVQSMSRAPTCFGMC